MDNHNRTAINASLLYLVIFMCVDFSRIYFTHHTETDAKAVRANHGLEARHQIYNIPMGNRLPTFSSFIVASEATHGKPRDFGAVFSMNAVQGASENPTDGDVGAVSLYDDINCNCKGASVLKKDEAGAIMCWAGNDLLNVYGSPQGAYGREINITNHTATMFGRESGQTGSAGAVASVVGLNITAIGPGGANNPNGASTISAGIQLGTQGHQEFQRGLEMRIGSIKQCGICDYGSGATHSIDIRGPHSLGIDLSALEKGQPIRVPMGESGYIVAGDDDRSIELIGGGLDRSVNIGPFSSRTNIWSDLMPKASSIHIGQQNNRFESIWSNRFHAMLYTPPSSSASCAPGDFSDDTYYHYVCVAANTWKRSALTAF